MSSTHQAAALHLPPVNGHLGHASVDASKLMARVISHFEILVGAGWTPTEIAQRYGLSASLVYKLLNGGVDYSALAVREVLGIHTQEVRLVVLVDPASPPLPPIVFMGAALPVGLTLQEVADLAGCTLRTVQRYVRRGRIEIAELVPGRSKFHRLARVADSEARRWAGWYRSKEAKRGKA